MGLIQAHLVNARPEPYVPALSLTHHAMLQALKIYLYYFLLNILCSRTKIMVRLLCFLCTSLQKQLIACSEILL